MNEVFSTNDFFVAVSEEPIMDAVELLYTRSKIIEASVEKPLTVKHPETCELFTFTEPTKFSQHLFRRRDGKIVLSPTITQKIT